MKKTIYSIMFVLFLIMSTNVQAQEPTIIQTGENLEKFRGTWVYQSNDTIFKINIQHKAKTIDSGRNVKYITHCLLGGYSLQVKGVMIENNIGEVPDVWYNSYDYPRTPKNITIYVESYRDRNGREVYGDSAYIRFIDPTLRYLNDAEESGSMDYEHGIKLLSPNKLRWRLSRYYDFSVPIDVIMTKEE